MKKRNLLILSLLAVSSTAFGYSGSTAFGGYSYAYYLANSMPIACSNGDSPRIVKTSASNVISLKCINGGFPVILQTPTVPAMPMVKKIYTAPVPLIKAN